MKSFNDLAFEDYFRILRQRILAFGITAIVVGTGVAYYAWQLPPLYRSETKIVVEAPGVTGALVGSRQNDIDDEIDMVRTQLTSRTILERIAEEFQISGEKGSIEGAVRWLQEGIGVTFARRNTIALAFTNQDPVLARDITKRLAEELIRMNDSIRAADVTLADQFLDEQLHQSKRELAVVEKKISDFKVAHLGELPEQGGANLSSLAGLNTQLVASEAALQRAFDQRTLLETRLQDEKRLAALYPTLPTADPTLSMTLPAGNVTSEEASQLNAELETRRSQLTQLKAKYTREHPDVLRLTREIQDLVAQVNGLPPERVRNTEVTIQTNAAESSSAVLSEVRIAELRTELQSTVAEIERRTRERDGIQQQIQLYQRRLNLAPKLEQQLLALTREYEALRDRHSGLQQQKFNTQMLASLETKRRNPNFTIIDEANLPELPVGPDRPMIASVGLGIGVLLGIALAFTREYLDPTLRDEEEASSILDIPTLVSIPDISLKPNGVYFPTQRSAPPPA